MDGWLRQSTVVTIQIGPFLDKGDGVSEETASTLSVLLSKNGGAAAARSSSTATTHDTHGMHFCPLNATDTNTLGILKYEVFDSATFLPVWGNFLVVPANVYDALVVGTAVLSVDTTRVGGTTQTARDLGASVIVASGTITSLTNPATVSSGTVTSITNPVVVSSGTITTVTGNVAGSVASVSGAVASVTAPVTVTSGTITSVSGAVGSVTAPVVVASGTITSITNAVNIAAGQDVRNVTGTFSASASAQINDEVKDVIFTDTQAELAAPPASDASIAAKINFGFMALKNERTQGTTQATIANDAGSVVATATVSDTASLFTKGKFA